MKNKELSNMKIIKSYQKFFEDVSDDLIKETDKLEDELKRKLNFINSAEGNWSNFMSPDFSADKIKRDKSLLDCFFFTRPCQKMIVGKVVEFTKKLVELTNVETMMNYYSILFSYRDEIEELYKKLDKAKNSENNQIRNLSSDYKQWVTSLDYIKSEIDKDDFAKKIIPEDELVVTYRKKDEKGQANAKITKIDLNDDGTVEFVLDNEKVGEVKKDLKDLVVKDIEESDVEADLKNKMTDILKNKPEEVKRILKFTNFISDDNNKEQIEQIKKIISGEN